MVLYIYVYLQNLDYLVLCIIFVKVVLLEDLFERIWVVRFGFKLVLLMKFWSVFCFFILLLFYSYFSGSKYILVNIQSKIQLEILIYLKIYFMI